MLRRTLSGDMEDRSRRVEDRARVEIIEESGDMCKIKFRHCGVDSDGWLRRVHVRPWHLHPEPEKCNATAPAAGTPSHSTTVADPMPATIAKPTATVPSGAQLTGAMEDNMQATQEKTHTTSDGAQLADPAGSSPEATGAPIKASIGTPSLNSINGSAGAVGGATADVPEDNDARYQRLIAELYKLHDPAMMCALPSVCRMHAGNLERAYSKLRHKYEASQGTAEVDADRLSSHAGGRVMASQPQLGGATPSQEVWNRHRTEVIRITLSSASIPPLFQRGFLDITANSSVRSLKHRIQEMVQHPTYRQNLVCKGMYLEQDESTLASYNVQNGDEVFVIDRGVRPQLRFCVGTRVECCVQTPGGLGLTWQTGTVSAQWYREAHGPEHAAHPYQVALDTGVAVSVPQDAERSVRKVETVTVAAVWSDRVESIEAGLEEPIRNLKARIVQLANLDPMLCQYARLWLGGAKLADEWPVSAYRRPTLRGSRNELTNGSSLLLTTHDGSSEVGHSWPLFRISVDTPFSQCGDDSDDDTSGNIDMKVFQDESIRSVKARAMRETRAHEHPDSAHVFYRNEYLAEHRSLRECGVPAGGMLQIALR